MADDILVRFGGDSSQFESAAERTAESVAKLEARLKDMKSAADKLSSDTAMIVYLEKLRLWFDGMGMVTTAVGVGLINVTEGLIRFKNEAVSGFPTLQANLDGVAQRWKSYAEAQAYSAEYAPLVQIQNDGITASIGRMMIAIDTWKKSADMYSSGLIQAAANTVVLQQGLVQAEAQAERAGYENVTRQVQGLAGQLSRIPDITDRNAAAIAGMFAAIPDSTGEVTKLLTDMTTQLSTTGDEARKLAPAMAEAFIDPGTKGEQFLRSLGVLNTEMQGQLRSARDSNDLYEMRAVLIEGIRAKEELVLQSKMRQTAEDQQMYSGLGRIGNILALGNRDLQGRIRLANEANAAFERQGEELKKVNDVLRQGSQSIEEQKSAMERVVSAANPLADRMAALAAKIATIKAGLAASGSAGTERETQALKKHEAEYGQLVDIWKGGSAVQKNTAYALEKELAGHKDKIADLQTEVKLYENIWEQSKGTEQEAARHEFYLQKKLELQKAINNAARAELEARKAEAETPEQKRDAGKSIARQKLAEAGDDAAERRRALTEMGNYQREYDQLQIQRKRQTLDTEYAMDTAALDNRKLLIKEEVETGRMSAIERLGADQRVEQDRIEVERRYWTQLLGLATAGTVEYDRIKGRLANIDAEGSNRMLKVYTQDLKGVEQQFRSAFDQIGSSVTSSVMGMLQGTQKFQDLLKNVATSIVQYFLQAGMKMVTTWAANQASMLALTVSSKAAETTAITAAATAQTAAVAAGATASKAAKGALGAAEVIGDSAVAAAGVTAFLAPIMGPGAVAAGTAVGAEVAAMAPIAAMDIGAWNIPHDQLAMIHKNELVMPASQADAFRRMLSGEGAPAASGDVHLHVHAVDHASVAGLFRSNGRALATVLRDVVNANPSLRPTY